MNSLAPIRTQLEFIKQNLIQHPIFVRGTGVAVDDPAYAEETRQLDNLRQRLGIQIRELSNRQHLLTAQEQAVWKVSREQRYAAGSSLDQQQASVRELLRIAAEIQRLLEDLIKKSGLLKSGEVACGIGELITRVFEQCHGSEVMLSGSHAVYTALGPGQFNASPEAATIAVFVALQAWISIRRRKVSALA
jgi:hypothetical protein